ncbi:SRPBCC family protein [Haladaptatus sp. DJG-WS-42]|uniref:SRPBCC family protein n=1 Tax=Haladaptatus sp. DJG-WS-42 TaxID=3120516 RepID=UPI0030CCF49C
MTVRVAETFELPATPARVWEFIADPAKRAEYISVVDSYTIDNKEGTKATWQISIPIPFIDKTVPVRTEDVKREEPRFIKFVGKSSVMHVVGEHELTETETGTQLANRFVVEGKVPGVERFFKRNLSKELSNLEAALLADLSESAE